LNIPSPLRARGLQACTRLPVDGKAGLRASQPAPWAHLCFIQRSTKGDIMIRSFFTASAWLVLTAAANAGTVASTITIDGFCDVYTVRRCQ